MAMTMISDGDLRKTWNEAIYHSDGYVKVDPSHPLEWYIGYADINQKTLVLVSEVKPLSIVSSKSVVVVVGKRADEKWALSFRLVRHDQEDVFIRLCVDLIESSRNQKNNTSGIEFVVRRYGQWLKLMESQGSGLLSESEKMGLIGELDFLQRRISSSVEVANDIRGWVGPSGADQDFVYNTGWHEVKAVGASSIIVSISSLEQLNACFPGELVVVFLDKTASGDFKGFTLKDKVAVVHSALQSTNLAVDLFQEKLLQYGYIDLPEYEREWYKISAYRRYRLDEEFPRLTRGNVPVQVAAARYELSLQAIEAWRIE